MNFSNYKKRLSAAGLIMAFAVNSMLLPVSAAEQTPINVGGITVNGGEAENVRLIVNSKEINKGKAVIAVYDGEKKMTAVKTVSNIDSEFELGEHIIDLDEKIPIPDGGKVKCFLWQEDKNGISIKPFGEMYEQSRETPTPTPDTEETPTPTPDTEETPTPTPDTEETPTPTPDTDPVGDGIIHLYDTYISAEGIENVTVDGTVVTISAAGEYTVEGNLTDGQIVVDTADKSEKVEITLNGVNVSCSDSAPFNAKNGKITLVLADGKVNTFTDTENYVFSDGEDEPNACVYSKRDLTIEGTGTLNVDANYNNGIGCKKDIKLKQGTYVIDAVNHGIKGKKSVTIQGNSTVTIKAGQDGIQSDETDYEDSAENLGTVEICESKKGTPTLNITSGGDGIQAFGFVNISAGMIDITSTEDSIKTNGTLAEVTLDEDAVDADGNSLTEVPSDLILGVINISGGEITINSSQDGIQADTEINISGGSIKVESCSEDAVNCGGNINITDGVLDIICKNDAVQSDGILMVSGGEITAVTNGGSNAGSADVDYSCKGLKGLNLVYISGGTINIDSYDDAIHSNHTVRIKGGSITASTGDDGVHGDSYLFISDDAEINVTKSYEGIEAAEIYISGGKTVVTSSDDGANAAGEKPTTAAYDIVTNGETAELTAFGWGGGPGGEMEDSASYGYLEVSGGILYIEAEGDGFDSNGSALISGGTVLVNGPTSGGNGVFDIGDSGDSKLSITGGTIVGAGTADMAVTPDSSSQYYVLSSSGSNSGGGFGGMGGRPGQSTSSGVNIQAGQAFKLTDSTGAEIITYVPSKKTAWLFISTPEMTNGTYTLNYGGSVTGGTFTKGSYGIVTGGTYTGTSTTTLTATK